MFKDNKESLRKENIEPSSTTIIDTRTKRKYTRGAFLGKGGFAKCYEVTDTESAQILACKIVSKSSLIKPHQKDKMASEIKIHKSITHAHIVKFVSYFEDKSNVYILLELCSKRTLLELHKRRKMLTDPEVRYYVYQISQAIEYMHHNHIIHRDLKLGNLFLDDKLQIKVGDFGLAAHIEYAGERKKTLCGTPNYIAPEILNKTGHSLEVDIWSLGCILYTLQAGDPPFETSNVKDTYNRIKKSDYVIPSRVPKHAQMLIVKLLQSDPKKRPSISEVLNDNYFVCGYMPSSLPLSSLTVAPRFPNLQLSVRENDQTLSKVHTVVGNTNIVAHAHNIVGNKNTAHDHGNTRGVNPDNPAIVSDNNRDVNPISNNNNNEQNKYVYKSEKSHALRVCDSNLTSFDDGDPNNNDQYREPKDCYLNAIADLITKCLAKNPHKYPKISETDSEDPASAPFYWVSRWIDYSEKYGIGYQLSDRSFGVLFNDHTRLVSTEDKNNIAYIDELGTETCIKLDSYDACLKKKMTLLTFFYDYMRQNLLTAGSDIQVRKCDEMIRLPTLRMWRRDSTLIVFLLSCGILQANFFDDHVKLIICPHLSSVTFIDQSRQSHTYRFSLIEKYGCTHAFYSKLKTVLGSVKKLIASLEPQNNV